MIITASIQLDAHNRLSTSKMRFLKGVEGKDSLSFCIDGNRLDIHRTGEREFDDMLAQATVDAKKRVIVPVEIRDIIEGKYLYVVVEEDNSSFILIKDRPLTFD